MTPLDALACPQCGGSLPRVALWKTVTCGWCGATVVHARPGVRRATFAAALANARTKVTPLAWRGRHYEPVGNATGELIIVRRVGPDPERIGMQYAAGPQPLQREAAALMAIRALDVPGVAHFRQRLPEPLGIGRVNDGREALGLRLPPGHAGTLRDVWQACPGGIDPRHGVWIWRRLLEVLIFVHRAGWAHGRIAPEHALVHPADHGVTTIGWSDAARAPAAQTADLQRSAWTVRALLPGAAPGAPGTGPATPEPFARLLRDSSEDAASAHRFGAVGLEAALTVAAAAAFGPPSFVPFDPFHSTRA